MLVIARLAVSALDLGVKYTTQIGHRPAPSDVASWQNSQMVCRCSRASEGWPDRRMRAVVLERYGPPEALRFGDRSDAPLRPFEENSDG